MTAYFSQSTHICPFFSSCMGHWMGFHYYDSWELDTTELSLYIWFIKLSHRWTCLFIVFRLVVFMHQHKLNKSIRTQYVLASTLCWNVHLGELGHGGPGIACIAGLVLYPWITKWKMTFTYVHMQRLLSVAGTLLGHRKLTYPRHIYARTSLTRPSAAER